MNNYRFWGIKCYFCTSGKGELCADLKSIGKNLHGGFAEFVVAPIDNIATIPDSLPFETATLADGLATALHCYHISGSPKGKDVLIYGDGPIGLECSQIFVLKNRVTVVGKHLKNLEIAHEIGAATEMLYKDTDVIENRYDCVIEAVGKDQDITLYNSIKSVRHGGMVVVCGVFSGNYLGKIPLWPLFYKEAVLCGSNSYAEKADGIGQLRR